MLASLTIIGGQLLVREVLTHSASVTVQRPSSFTSNPHVLNLSHLITSTETSAFYVR